MKKYLLLLFSVACCCSTYAADVDTTFIVEAEAAMSSLMEDILTNKDLKVRQEASEELEALLEKTLTQSGSFEHDFSELKGISLVQPEDKTVRIFTWQLYIDKDHYQYRGFIQTKEGKVYRLQDKSDDMRTVEFSIHKPENWYGALYYNIKAFKSEGQTMYLLFGYDAFDFYNRRKLLDVLYFDNSGRPRFGKTVLEMKDGSGRMRKVKRFVMEYSASVNVSLNYSEEQDMIIYDHLIYGSPIKSAGPSNVPDGSYSGMKLSKDGTWKYVDKVHKDDPANILVDATSYERIIQNEKEKPKRRKKDLFGRSK
ncbi:MULTISPECIES: hypothetical protein [unclassified Aureispira]|uniref:hypothetical protein n=1 Tax=unclassified Aureispira TaxID=2649989 RepID=UPI000695F4C2|nr:MULTISPECIES: hypothetical protein [unclassified Aureispira]WMX17212.1 hypothetical protein QP953_12590 [Aureispira sp. CCB-E]